MAAPPSTRPAHRLFSIRILRALHQARANPCSHAQLAIPLANVQLRKRGCPAQAYSPISSVISENLGSVLSSTGSATLLVLDGSVVFCKRHIKLVGESA